MNSEEREVSQMMEAKVNEMLNEHSEMEGKFTMVKVSIPEPLMQPLQDFLEKPSFSNLGHVFEVLLEIQPRLLEQKKQRW